MPFRGQTEELVLAPRSPEFVVGLVGLLTQFQFAPQVRTDGITSFTREVELTRNALVRVYDLVVHAKRASGAPVETVAQVRATPASGRTNATIVLDFGTPRTVSGVMVQTGLAIASITPWIGTGFAPEPVSPIESSAGGTVVILRKEIRTERLLVEVTGTKTGAELWTNMGVVLPEAPTDLEIRIDGGPPVATFPGPAQPGSDNLLTDKGWNQNGYSIVHLADALAALTGDPMNSEAVTFQLVLSSRVPGELSIEVPPVNPATVGALAPHVTLSPPVLSYIRRMRFDAETSKELLFPEEGIQRLTLADLPPNPLVEEIRFTVAGTLPPERIIPPVGPDDARLADLVISQDRAVCVRLRPGTGLSELTGVRLPLRVGGSGAEMRVVLWRPGESGPEPFEVMPDGVSEPVTLAAGSGDEAWTTFLFKRPVPISDEALPNPPRPWVALLVSRGEVTWSLGATAGPRDPINDNVIRRGAPTGPWKQLPSPFQNPASPLSSVRGRIRVIGHAPKDKPLAPLSINIGSSAQAIDVTPSAKGAAYRRSFFSPGVPSSDLCVVSLVPGNVTLRDLDVVTTT